MDFNNFSRLYKLQLIVLLMFIVLLTKVHTLIFTREMTYRRPTIINGIGTYVSFTNKIKIFVLKAS